MNRRTGWVADCWTGQERLPVLSLWPPYHMEHELYLPGTQAETGLTSLCCNQLVSDGYRVWLSCPQPPCKARQIGGYSGSAQ